MFRSYRNQSVDLLCKSIDWFVYDEDTGEWVNDNDNDIENLQTKNISNILEISIIVLGIIHLVCAKYFSKN